MVADMTTAGSRVKHPAKFTPSILDVIRDQLSFRGVAEDALILDPFAGVGRCHELGWDGTVGNELEMPWCREHTGMVVRGDACRLPFRAQTFDAAVTSPTYGNRFADKHRAKDGSVRRSYTHDLRASLGDEEYTLHPANTGGMKWGKDYWLTHGRAWDEVWRVLRDGGLFVVNVSDFIKNKQVVRVVDWHRAAIARRGFTLVDDVAVDTPRMRYGANGDLRAAEERVLVWEKDPF